MEAPNPLSSLLHHQCAAQCGQSWLPVPKVSGSIWCWRTLFGGRASRSPRNSSHFREAQGLSPGTHSSHQASLCRGRRRGLHAKGVGQWHEVKPPGSQLPAPQNSLPHPEGRVLEGAGMQAVKARKGPGGASIPLKQCRLDDRAGTMGKGRGRRGTGGTPHGFFKRPVPGAGRGRVGVGAWSHDPAAGARSPPNNAWSTLIG